jgi:hypothetical protein
MRREDYLKDWNASEPELVRAQLQTDQAYVSRVLHISTFRDLLVVGTKTYGDWPDGDLFLLRPATQAHATVGGLTVGGFGGKANHGLRHVAYIGIGPDLVAIGKTPPRSEACWLHDTCDKDQLWIYNLSAFAEVHLRDGRSTDHRQLKGFEKSWTWTRPIAALAGFRQNQDHEGAHDLVVAYRSSVDWLRFESDELRLVARADSGHGHGHDELLSMTALDYPRVAVGAKRGKVFILRLEARVNALDVQELILSRREFLHHGCRAREEEECDVVSVLWSGTHLVTAARDGSVNLFDPENFDSSLVTWHVTDETVAHVKHCEKS